MTKTGYTVLNAERRIYAESAKTRSDWCRYVQRSESIRRRYAA